MKNNLKKYSSDIIVSSVIFYIFGIFLSFDAYCKTQVTPETPLFNIAGLPFLRMEFVSIIFTAAFLIGSLVVLVLKKADKFLLPFALGFAGVLAIFISVFDVNTLQLISPTLRISHIIMTVSQVLAIVVAVSGGFMGAVCAVLCKQKISAKVVLPSALFATVLSVLANEENLQTMLFFISGILLLASSLLSDFFFEINSSEKVKTFAKSEILPFVSTMCVTALFGILYSVLYENTGFSFTGLTAVSGIVLVVLALILKSNYNTLLQPIAMFSGTIISFVLVHFAGNVVTYSSNRVVYVMPYSVAIVLSLICVILCIAMCALKNKNK